MRSTKYSLRLLLALFAITAHVYAQAGDKPGYLAGCITDAETGAGINGVMITLSSPTYSQNDYSFAGGTCGDGLYYIEIPYDKVGTYNATYSREGYIEQRTTVTISSGNRVLLNVALSPETGFIHITSSPSGASITIDGLATGQQTPYTFTKRVGTHTVSVSKEGYVTPATQTISVSKDSTTEVNFTLSLQPASPPVAPGGGAPAEGGLPQMEVLNGSQLINQMEREDDMAGAIFSFSVEIAPLAAVYAAGGDVVLSSENAEKLLAVRPEAAPRLKRVEAGDVYGLAAEYAQRRYPNADKVIVARGDLAVDALAAAPLAARLSAPILLVKTDEIPPAALKVLERKYSKIYVIGGSAAVSASVEQKLRNFSKDVTRLWGATRFETSIEVAKEIRRLDNNTADAILTLGDGHAIYSAVLAARYGVPLLYLDAQIKPEKMSRHQRAVSSFVSDTRLGVRTIYSG